MTGSDLRPRQAGQEFADVVFADEDLVRAEFEAIVAAGFGGPVPRFPLPSRGRRPDGSPRSHPVLWRREAAAHRGVTALVQAPRWVRQRSPPGTPNRPDPRSGIGR
ncbi:hypothetical protein ORV05_09945 [Amycolatopsis cynarae]|uniref:Uncharacterized protein n=1 Tax=Amycolatopsis cynarae TaxID=2995223 RepID=A0ABY7B7F9_9PSEU|nr:hypothetical protein [Amycolatopsis sp. HUAS 11-8]WAL68061.1 hypothetical protein ORV05_09945 [Amycolatopsis sp. HUAS 11-8]